MKNQQQIKADNKEKALDFSADYSIRIQYEVLPEVRETRTKEEWIAYSKKEIGKMMGEFIGETKEVQPVENDEGLFMRSELIIMTAKELRLLIDVAQGLGK